LSVIQLKIIVEHYKISATLFKNIFSVKKLSPLSLKKTIENHRPIKDKDLKN